MKLTAFLSSLSILVTAESDNSNYIRLSRSILLDSSNETTTNGAIINKEAESNIQSTTVPNIVNSTIINTTIPNFVNTSTVNTLLIVSKTQNNGSTTKKVVNTTIATPLYKLPLPQSNVTVLNNEFNGTAKNKANESILHMSLDKVSLSQKDTTTANKETNGTVSNKQKNGTATNNPNTITTANNLKNGANTNNPKNGTATNTSNAGTNKNNPNNGTATNNRKNGTAANDSNTGRKQSDKAEVLKSIMTNLTYQIPDAKKRLESSFNNLNFDNQTVVMKNLDFLSRAANKTLFSPDLIKGLNGSGINTEVWKNQVGNNSKRNKIDSNLIPSMWMLRTGVPWKHVSEAKRDNETEIVQICRFDDKTAICSAEYSKWNAKLWFDFAESQGKKGINISTYERGRKPRVSFYNKVNGTDCQIFNNGTFHQICVKIYGYETNLGPTRVCLQLGAAIFNHGVASTDLGCFRFGNTVAHENALEGEDPMPVLLNEHILQNDYNNNLEPKDDPNNGLLLSNNFLLTFSTYIITLIVLR